jgi:acetolactate decarboxylase
VIDERLIGALHLTSGTHEDDPGSGHRAFQASTIAALLDGAYEGDVTFSELAGRGDFGLGTLNGCDGEMIAIEGAFFRADTDGRTRPVAPEEKTPFAVLTWFEARHRLILDAPNGTDYDRICSVIDERVGHPEIVHAVRIDGRFERLHLRSIPKQVPPYRPLSELLAGQTVFDFTELEGTLVGFRFPDLGLGVGVAGYHFHFISKDRRRGGHVLDCRAIEPLEASVDDLPDLHVETPSGVRIGAGAVDAGFLDSLERDRADGGHQPGR